LALCLLANSDAWQQTLTIHPNNNRGTENNKQNNFDANGNLLHLDNIANLEWYYNNTLNKLTKADKTTQYNVYDYQGNRVIAGLIRSLPVVFAAFAEDVGTNV
jgi:insecticidal toxin complex protein TccC